VDVPLLVSVPAGRASESHREPVTGGVPLPRGFARENDGWTLVTADEGPLPLQTRVTDKWPDGSIRWLLVDTQVDVRGGEKIVPLRLRLLEADGVRSGAGPSRRAEASSEMEINAGAYTFSLDTRCPAIIAAVSGPEGRIYDGSAADIRLLGAAGERWAIEWNATRIECSGSVRVATVTEGTARGPNGRLLSLFMRFDFFSGHAVARMRLTVRNPSRAAHPGGIWELGDAGSVLLKELSVLLPAAAKPGARLALSVEPDAHAEGSRSVSVYQESSGGEHWSSPNHRTRTGIVPFRFRGYKSDVDGVESSGRRASPTVLISAGRSVLGAAVPYFWQNFPRALDATPSGLRVAFFPPEAPDLHELQGGEQKTHECYLCFAADRVTAVPLDWCHTRAVLHATPAWCAQSGAIPNLVIADDEEASYRSLAAAALEGSDTFAHKRERADEYGWRHFGDIYGDHEAVKSAAPLMSHYNNQYDPVAGFFGQFLRTADRRWWEHCEELCAHVVDIDVYHTDEDKSAYNHGLFWHTIHYIDAGKATHRSYPSGTVGGGPSAEQNYTTGLMLFYFFTGDIPARDTAIGLSQFVINMDDGSTTPFRFLARGYTGVASASRTYEYHGPGRGSGNSLNALVDGHRLTADGRFLEKAEQLIRRCTHPRQDIGALTLLDAENRWFYTMYLQALGKYLHWKIERDELDAMYAYGRDVLLHFARWMAEHERPYLERPERLEFPTETWAAQDIRKSEVFDHAARHGSANERSRFTERAEFFFQYSIDTLSAMPTRSLARPVVLLIVHGLLRAHARTHGVSEAPPAREEWASRWPLGEVFVPQKARAKKRLAQIAIGGVGAAAVMIAMWLFA